MSEDTKEFFSPFTSVFVGWKGYSIVGVVPMTILEGKEYYAEPGRLEDPSEWFAQGLGMEEMVDVNLIFKSKPTFNLSFSAVTRPTGVIVNVEKMNVTENPKIPKQVERIVSDEFRAVVSAKGLYDPRLEYDIAAEEAYGLLGIDREKKTKLFYIPWNNYI